MTYFHRAAIWVAFRKAPLTEASLSIRLIAVDAGSPIGPCTSVRENHSCPRRRKGSAYLLHAAVEQYLCIGSAGGAGAKPHLAWCHKIIGEVAREEGLSFRLAVIPADIPKSFLLEEMAAGKVDALGPVAPLTEAAVVDSTYLAAQMGPEPLIAALEGGADVILAGRCYDPAVFAAHR